MLYLSREKLKKKKKGECIKSHSVNKFFYYLAAYNRVSVIKNYNKIVTSYHVLSRDPSTNPYLNITYFGLPL